MTDMSTNVVGSVSTRQLQAWEGQVSMELLLPRLDIFPSSRMQSRLCRRTSTAGFTLLELLVVVAIIGLLAAYVGPKYFGHIGKSEQALAQSQIESFDKAMVTYRIDVGNFPSTEEGLNALLVKPSSATKWKGPYLSKAVPLDPWGRPYIYRSPGAKKEFDLLSYGKDGQPGGTDDAADVSNE